MIASVQKVTETVMEMVDKTLSKVDKVLMEAQTFTNVPKNYMLGGGGAFILLFVLLGGPEAVAMAAATGWLAWLTTTTTEAKGESVVKAKSGSVVLDTKVEQTPLLVIWVVFGAFTVVLPVMDYIPVWLYKIAFLVWIMLTTEAKSGSVVKTKLVIWVVFGAFTVVLPVMDYIPMCLYKIAFLVWIVLPQTNGAQFLYKGVQFLCEVFQAAMVTGKEEITGTDGDDKSVKTE